MLHYPQAKTIALHAPARRLSGLAQRDANRAAGRKPCAPLRRATQTCHAALPRRPPGCLGHSGDGRCHASADRQTLLGRRSLFRLGKTRFEELPDEDLRQRPLKV